MAHPAAGGYLLVLPPVHGASGFFVARLRRTRDRRRVECRRGSGAAPSRVTEETMPDLLHEIHIAPSILSADFSRLGDDVEAVLNAGARVIHVDVMDGHFVPNITIGPLIVAALQPLVHGAGALIDVHLMIEHPERYVEAFAAAGANVITVHQEACVHLHRVLMQIREAGAAAGVGAQPGDAHRDARRGARALRPRGRSCR